MISPVTGSVSAVNEELADEPQKMNEDPYGAWFVRVKDISETEELMSADEYTAFVKEEQEKAD